MEAQRSNTFDEKNYFENKRYEQMTRDDGRI